MSCAVDPQDETLGARLIKTRHRVGNLRRSLGPTKLEMTEIYKEPDMRAMSKHPVKEHGDQNTRHLTKTFTNDHDTTRNFELTVIVPANTCTPVMSTPTLSAPAYKKQISPFHDPAQFIYILNSLFILKFQGHRTGSHKVVGWQVVNNESVPGSNPGKTSSLSHVGVVKQHKMNNIMAGTCRLPFATVKYLPPPQRQTQTNMSHHRLYTSSKHTSLQQLPSGAYGQVPLFTFFLPFVLISDPRSIGIMWKNAVQKGKSNLLVLKSASKVNNQQGMWSNGKRSHLQDPPLLSIVFSKWGVNISRNLDLTHHKPFPFPLPPSLQADPNGHLTAKQTHPTFIVPKLERRMV
ncbi:hypothetical protein QBC36DRAFT_305843 [Triangularia setosa]|uniref:Uncharacterized protein n=1 Tax=Triangularia setosa TaxID=2587417 RepID=A0AAN6WH93_9PEZI|nr:hypothetical protein QBC36DRAFT_305843 [Podospora setosa]